ncbi:hypothetical protein [Nocardioides pantholopis]|uniref:hypothetical protein n=1 Tax=Nocardioides pantholopis TaxID=2483798 RepID=UPI0013E3CA9A|nr:hypothetical protein [Nocardioides pantholopis]
MAGLSAFLALLAGVVAWLVLTDDPYVATAPPGPAPRPEAAGAAGAAGAVRALQEAVRERDPDAAAALAGDADAGSLLTAVVANAAELRVADFSLRYVDADAGPTRAGAWTASVATTWRFAGMDATPASAEVRFGFVQDDGEVRITTIGGGAHRTPLWLAGPVAVRRTPQTLVLAAGGAPVARRFERLALEAVPVVSAVLSRWRPALVLEVPRSAAELDRALAAEPGTYSAIAAVTTTVDGSVDDDAPVHVLANPEEFASLGAVGARVVMSHEVTHLATGGATSPVPLWLLEGFADHVALRDVDLPLRRTAAQVIRQVRRDGPPAALPGAAEFDVGGPHLGAVYESAWLACTVLVERGGEDALVELYERADRGEPVGEALTDLFGWSEADLVAAWRDRLREVAS